MLEEKLESMPAILKRRNWLILTVLLLASIPLLSWRFTLGILIGGILVNVNFHLLHRTLVNTLMVKKTKQGVVLKYLLRLFATGVVILIVLMNSWVNVFGLIIGVSVVVINLIYLSLTEAKGIVLK